MLRAPPPKTADRTVAADRTAKAVRFRYDGKAGNHARDGKGPLDGERVKPAVHDCHGTGDAL